MKFIFLVETGSNAVTSSTRYFAPDGATISFQSAEGTAQFKCPHGITIDEIYIDLAASPGSTQTVHLRKNGSNHANDPAISIASGATAGSATAIGATYAQDDLINLSWTSGSTMNSGGISIIIVYSSSVGEVGFFFASTAGTTTTFVSPVLLGGQNATESFVYVPLPATYGITNLVADVSAAPGTAGSGKKWTIAARLNGADSAVTFDILETATTNNDRSHTATAAVEDTFSIHCTAVSTPASATIKGSYTIIPPSGTEKGLFMSSHENTLNTPGTANNTGLETHATGYTSATALGNSQNKFHTAVQLNDIAVKASGAAGSGKSWTAAPRIGGSVQSAMNCAISGTTQTHNVTTGQQVNISSGDLVDVNIADSGTPTVSRFQIGISYTLNLGTTYTKAGLGIIGP